MTMKTLKLWLQSWQDYPSTGINLYGLFAPCVTEATYKPT
ncbi:hypothetical protein NIES4106_58580 (plasmid) [Fischerella sp. NIES-4106]|nr:hypothetical protein NIES4106_58580 [Fischerella sp. NIES-4106]